MKKIFTLLVFSCFAAICFAQQGEVVADASTGFYMTKDGVTHQVWIANDNESNRAKYVSIPNQKNHEGKALFPHDIAAYGVGGKLYISNEITYRGEKMQVFLEEMFKESDGRAIYYYCDDKGQDVFFMVAANGEMTAATPESPQPIWDFIKVGSTCSDLEGARPFPKKLTYNNVNVFYTAYRDCNANLFQKFTWGINAAVGGVKFKTNEVPDYEFKYSTAFSVGLFASIPLDQHFTFKPALNLNIVDNNTGRPLHKGDDMQYKRTSLQLPALFCYNHTLRNGKTIPYVELGPLFDYALSGDKYIGGVKQVHDSGDVVDYKSIIDFHWGASIGAGVKQKISPNHSILIGVSWKYTYGKREDYTEKLNYWMFTAGFCF